MLRSPHLLPRPQALRIMASQTRNIKRKAKRAKKRAAGRPKPPRRTQPQRKRRKLHLSLNEGKMAGELQSKGRRKIIAKKQVRAVRWRRVHVGRTA